MERLTENLFVYIIAAILGIFLFCYILRRFVDYCSDHFLDYCFCPDCGYTCVCSCFGHNRNRGDYEGIEEPVRTNETGKIITHIEIGESFGTKEVERSFGQRTCGICLEEMNVDEDLYRTPCRHKFHTYCLKRWLEENNRCPLCNSSVRLTEVAETQVSSWGTG